MSVRIARLPYRRLDVRRNLGPSQNRRTEVIPLSDTVDHSIEHVSFSQALQESMELHGE